VGLPRPPKAPEPRAPKEEKGGERTYGSATRNIAISDDEIRQHCSTKRENYALQS